MKKLLSKVAALKFLKKTVIFCIGYIVMYSITMIIIYCIKDSYPELLTTVTFAYFSIESVISGGIKIYETFAVKRKKKIEETETNETPAQPEEETFNEHI